MLKLLTVLLLVLFFNACGVDTSSSKVDSTSSDTTEPVDTDAINDNPNYGLDVIDPNPIVGDGTDSNTSDNNTTDEPVVIPNDDQNNSDFDTNNAILDQFACVIGSANLGFANNTITDDSFDYLSAVDPEDGVEVYSKVTNYNDVSKTEVTLYYHDLKPIRTMETLSAHENKYRATFDLAWATNDKTFVYVKTPKDSSGHYGCFRYDLKNINKDSKLLATKVYSINI